METRKLRSCKAPSCKEKFEPRGANQIVCSPECAYELQKKKNEKVRKEMQKQDRAKIREMKLKLKTHSKWIQELQVIFNKYVRLRDKNLPCISCGTQKDVRWSAGHYFPAGSYPMVRFDEDNVWKQCWNNCNKNRHGNLANYKIGLIERVGENRFQELEERTRIPLKLTIPEIIELKTYYKQLIKNEQKTTTRSN